MHLICGSIIQKQGKVVRLRKFLQFISPRRHSHVRVSLSAFPKMVKKARAKARGIDRGLQRHKIRAKLVEEDSVVLKALNYVGAGTGRISVAAEAVLKYITRVCTLFCLIPIEPSGQHFQLAPLWKRTVHYSLASFYISFTTYKLAVTVYLLLYTELNLREWP